MNLFDIIEEAENKELAELMVNDDQFRKNLQEKCPHLTEEMTETDWGPPWGLRLTWTCKRCKRVRGRC